MQGWGVYLGWKSIMNAADRYRRSARRCLLLAGITGQEERIRYLQMAEQWRELAEVAERNEERATLLVSEDRNDPQER